MNLSRIKKISSLFSVVVILTGLAAIYLAVSAATSYRAVVGTPITVNEQGTCQIVTNSGSSDVFIPTNTSNEWSLFRLNKPAYVSLAGCIVIVGNNMDNVSPGTCNGHCSNIGKTCLSVGLDAGATNGEYYYATDCSVYIPGSGATCGFQTTNAECAETATQCRCQ